MKSFLTETQSCDKQQAGCSHTQYGQVTSLHEKHHQRILWKWPVWYSFLHSKSKSGKQKRTGQAPLCSDISENSTSEEDSITVRSLYRMETQAEPAPDRAAHRTLQEGKLTVSAIQGCLHPNCELTTYTGNKQERYGHSECKRDTWISLRGQTLTKPCTYSKLCAGTQ